MSLSFNSPFDLILKPITGVVQSLLFNNAIIMLALSLAMLFLSLKFFISTMKPLVETEFAQVLNDHFFTSPLRSFILGILMTITVQSSSVSTSLIVPLAGIGMLTLEKAFPYLLGANIGTTITALMASLVTGSPAAITVALGHLSFNIYGTAVFYPLRKIPILMARLLADISFKSKVYPVAYITSIFYILPSSVIFFFH